MAASLSGVMLLGCLEIRSFQPLTSASGHFLTSTVSIGQMTLNLPSRLAQSMTQIDRSKWPASVIGLYLGQITPEAVFAAADDPDAKTKTSQVCEANFFTGELELQRGSKDEAVRLFRLAAAECAKNACVWAHANAELKALGVQP
jgi:lipoprotein NlpI